MFNDELLQIQKDTFHRILLGIGAVGFITAVNSAILGGFGSAWFLRAVVLLMAAAVAYAVSIFRRVEVASYVLVFQLVVLALAAFLQPDVLNSLIPYLFIPIVIITGTLLKPRVSLVVAGGLIVVTLLIHVWLAGVAVMALSQLAFPLGLTAVTAMLMAINARNLMLFDDRLLANRTLLKGRALELMQANNLLGKFEQQMAQLENRLQETQSTADQLQTGLNQRMSVLLALIDGSIGNLNEAIAEIEAIVEQLADTPALNGQRQLVDEAWQKLYRLRSFVVNLDELAQIEQNSFQLNFSEIDINRLLLDVASATQGLVRDKNLEIRVHSTEGLPLVTADPDRLRLVLLHLVNNAIKFTDEGLVEMRAEQDGRQLVVKVIDTGIGMTGEEATRAFDLFSRGNDPATRERHGSGLGLAICRHLIELHGGRMWVTSAPGNGSIFYFSLPLRPVAEPVYATSATTTTLRAGASNKFRAAAPVAAAASAVRPHRQGAPASAPVTQRATMPPAAINPVAAAPASAAPDPAAEVDGGATLILRAPKAPQNPRNIQPIHRYQPMYIQRFGYILLGMLIIVMAVVASLAVINSDSLLTDDPLPPVANAVSTAGSTPVDDLSTNAPTARTLAAAVSTAAVVAPSPSPQPTVTAAVNDASTVAVATAVAETAFSTPLPPPATEPLPAPTATPLPPTFTATALPLAVQVFPTSTPAPVSAQPAAVIEPAPRPSPTPTSSPAPVIFIAGPGGISQASTGGESGAAFPLAAEPNSRVSLSSGGQMVYSGVQHGGRDVFVAGPDGQPTNLTNTPTDDIQPAWSPDGARVAFSSGRTGSFKIFSMGADGSGPTQLTDGRGFDEWPAWSPDGQQVAFVSDRDGNAEIYLVDADGGNLRRLTNNTAEDWPVSWSPGGRWLVFGSNRDGNWNLYLLPAAGGAPVQLTNHPADERDPVWLPNGDIAFAHNGPGNWDIFTLSVPTNQIGPVAPDAWTQVTDTPQDERFPALVN